MIDKMIVKILDNNIGWMMIMENDLFISKNEKMIKLNRGDYE